MHSRNYVFEPRQATAEEQTIMRTWLQPLYDINRQIMEHLRPKEDPSKILFVCDAGGQLTANRMEVAHELRHEFLEYMRDQIRAAPAVPRYAVFQSVIYRRDLRIPNAAPIEELAFHLETPDNLAGSLIAKIIRSRKGPPQLGPPDFSFYETATKIQGGMCGFFLPRSRAFGDYAPPMPPLASLIDDEPGAPSKKHH
jgi:hypothetical protein